MVWSGALPPSRSCQPSLVPTYPLDSIGTPLCVSQPRPLPTAMADALLPLPARFSPLVTSICRPS